MNLVAYPFDTQICIFLIRLKDVPKDFVSLRQVAEGIVFLGPKDLREYRIKEVEMFTNDRDNYSGKAIRISFENLSGFYVSTTYLPTFFMVAICYSTLYYNIDDFNDRIMVSLTALLVLATLFTQITQTTPKTAYLKLLDIWFVSAIVIDFLIIMILVTINFFKLREGFEAYNETTPVFTFGKSNFKHSLQPKENNRLSERINRYAQISIPILIFLFVFSYIVLSVWVM